MITFNPFVYPTNPHTRIRGPAGYTDYTSYKPFLRDEFSFRCVFCLERERWYPNRDAAFSVEHFIAKARCPERECDYDNLLYACVRCNSFKQDKVVRLDPTQVAFADHFVFRDDGRLEGCTPEAKDLLDLLHLNESPALDQRQQILRIVRLKQKLPNDTDVCALFVEVFKYPDDLPDLETLKPKSNNRPDGIKVSHFARKGELPKVY
jgi:hypothetical protein